MWLKYWLDPRNWFHREPEFEVEWDDQDDEYQGMVEHRFDRHMELYAYGENDYRREIRQSALGYMDDISKDGDHPLVCEYLMDRAKREALTILSSHLD